MKFIAKPNMPADQVRKLVDEGKRVFITNTEDHPYDLENAYPTAYEVIKDNIGQYLIKCFVTDHYIGLTWQDEVTPNYHTVIYEDS